MESNTKLNEVEIKIFKFCSEKRFYFFVQHFIKILEPQTKFKWSWYTQAIADHCQMVYEGKYFNLDINVPPRSLKSLIVGVLFPCWVWTQDSSNKFLCASRSFDLSLSFNIMRRDIIISDLYQSLWPIQIREDKNRSDEFMNTNHGFMKSVSALGKITGEGGDYLLSDDLIDAMDAFSRAKREQVTTWYKTAFYNRAQDANTVKRININQRLHQKDISGLLKELGFYRLVLPMRKTNKELSTVEFKDPRQEGELLNPERFTEENFKEYQKTLGSYSFSGQYQQSPTPVGGGLIKEEWLRYHDKTSCSYKIIVADLTFKGNENSDYNSIACWGREGSNKYLLDQIRGKWTYSKMKEMFIQFYDKHNPNTCYIEDKANGSALIDEIKKEKSGIIAWPRQGSKYIKSSKVERLFYCQSEFEGGNVYLPMNHEIIEVYKSELLGFTESGSTTGNDDMVDTTSMAVLELKAKSTFAIG